MDSDAFWCITLGLLILSAFWKHQRAKGVVERNRNTVKAKWDRKRSRKEDRKSTRLNSSHSAKSRMPSSA